ncbi:MAG: hypothetical protein WAU45_07715 [Blastocatellia bacterium]
MSNDTTQILPNGPSFEERVFARFDAFEQRAFAHFESISAGVAGILERQQGMEERQQGMEERQQRMEERQQRMETRQEKIETRLDEIDRRLQVLEQKTYDTKPIWERAIAELLELREDVHTLDRKFNIITRDLLTLRAEQNRLEDRMDKIDSKPA